MLGITNFDNLLIMGKTNINEFFAMEHQFSIEKAIGSYINYYGSLNFDSLSFDEVASETSRIYKRIKDRFDFKLADLLFNFYQLLQVSSHVEQLMSWFENGSELFAETSDVYNYINSDKQWSSKLKKQIRKSYDQITYHLMIGILL